MMQERIVSAIKRELTEGGLKEVSYDPDLFVTSHVTTKENTVYNTTTFGYGGYGGGWYGWGGGMGSSSTTATNYTEGTLIIDGYRASDKKMVWRGTGTVTVKSKPEKQIQQVDKILKSLATSGTRSTRVKASNPQQTNLTIPRPLGRVFLHRLLSPDFPCYSRRENYQRGERSMAQTSIGRLAGILVLAFFVASFGGVGFAQEAASPPAEGEGETPEAWNGVIEEIVVTAQKREQNVQDVPVSISTLSGEDLDTLTTGGADVRMLSGRVPSLVMESSFGRAFPRFYIRGIGNPDFDLNASQPVSMVIDEVVMENPIVKGMPLFDLERVEVLRGPQGTLFGRNTPAGIVKFDTVKPSQEFDAYARVSYGTYDTMDIQGGVGGALSKTISARFSGLYQSRSDWVDNQYEPGPESKLGAYTTTAARLQFLWEPNDKFSGLLNLHGWDVDGTARIFRANILQQGEGGLVDGFNQDEVWHDGRNSQDIESFGGVLKLDYDFGAATFVSVTGYETVEMYSRGDIDGGFGAVFLGEGNYGPGFIQFASETADGLPELDQFTQEFRLVSNSGGPVNWLAGVFFFDESLKVDSFNFDSLAGGADDGYAYQYQDSNAWALFGSVDWQVSDDWTLRAGLRYSSDEKDFRAQRVQPLFINNLLFGTELSVVIPVKVDDSFTSWDLSATYAVNDDVNLYGRVATGFRAPSIQGRILFCADIDGTDPVPTVFRWPTPSPSSPPRWVSTRSSPTTAAAQSDRLHLRDERPTDHRCRGRSQYQHPSECRQDRGLRPGSRHPVDSHRQLEHDVWLQLQPHQVQRQGPQDRRLRRRLHDHRSGGRRGARPHRRQQPGRCPRHGLQRHHQLAVRPGGQEILRHPGLGLPFREVLHALRFGGVQGRQLRARASWATPSRRPSTRSPSTAGTSPTRST